MFTITPWQPECSLLSEIFPSGGSPIFYLLGLLLLGKSFGYPIVFLILIDNFEREVWSPERMTSGWRDIWIEGAAQYFSFS
jgi:hypothetical protein